MAQLQKAEGLGQCSHKLLHHGIVVQGRRSEAKPFGPDGHRRIVDGLDVDTVPSQKPIARSLALHRVTDGHGHNVRLPWHHRQTFRQQQVLRSERSGAIRTEAVTEIPLRFYSFHLRFLSVAAGPQRGVPPPPTHTVVPIAPSP
jgi:hypothetical protein